MDIEDLDGVFGGDVASDAAAMQRRSAGSVSVKKFRRAKPLAGSSDDKNDKNGQNERNGYRVDGDGDGEGENAEAAVDGSVDTDASGYLPGRGRVFVKTWGCGHNNSDGEYMAGQLAAAGFDVALDQAQAQHAQLWLLNSCTVKGPSEQTFTNDVAHALALGKRVVVAGCVPQANPRDGIWSKLSIIGVQQIDRVVDVVQETLLGNTVQLLRDHAPLPSSSSTSSSTSTLSLSKRKPGGAPLDLPKIRRNPYIEIIPINTGCLNSCTYCKTKHARGELGSYSPSEIIDRVVSVLDEGVKEIWLTSEDTGAYGRDIGVSIVSLLDGIISAMETHSNKDAMLRVGMTNPPYILEHLDGIARILAHPRVFAFLHVPVQSGSTSVLNDMRRLYTREDFETVVDVLKAKVPGVTIATDIICGFPTESDQDFDQTMALLEKYRLSVVHISQFYPRPGTPAARMKRIATNVVKARSRRATAFFESYRSYDHFINTVHRILVTEQSADGKHYVGHNKFYHQILVAQDPRLMGRSFRVKIVEVGKFFMKGEPLDTDLDEIQKCIQAELVKAAADAGSSALVTPKRLPKLIRVKRGVVAVSQDSPDMRHSAPQRDDDNDSTVNHDLQDPDASADDITPRSDGAELSLGVAARIQKNLDLAVQRHAASKRRLRIGTQTLIAGI
eukprot:jgi/Hompol1/1945/HPOL_002800-RA